MTPQELLKRNAEWSARMEAEHPGFFENLAEEQHPDFLWIGCSDSRVPVNQIAGLRPGDVFVHRNVANQVSHGDLNCQSVLQFAVEALQVKHIIVCGHFGCGGVCAAMANQGEAAVAQWLAPLRSLYSRYATWVDEAADLKVSQNRMCAINVIEQVSHICESSVVQAAWKRGQSLSVHGWIYDLHDGRLRDLGLTLDADSDLQQARDEAIERLKKDMPQAA